MANLASGSPDPTLGDDLGLGSMLTDNLADADKKRKMLNKDQIDQAQMPGSILSAAALSLFGTNK